MIVTRRLVYEDDVSKVYEVVSNDGTVVGTDIEGIPTPEQANESTLREQAKASIVTLRASIDTLKTVTDKTNANIGPADTKTVARETRRVARQLVALTRLFLGELDSTDTGTE